MVLSTCDRVEVLACHADREAAFRMVSDMMAERAGIAPAELAGQLYVHWDAEAVRHVFTVTASLDSQVIGEPQVLGQVKAGHRIAREAAMTGTNLEALLQAAYAAAKRVRSETAIGERPVSIAAAAVQLARDLHGDLGRCAGLLIGAGEMGELVAGELLAGGLSDLTVIHPTEARAQALARALDCHFSPYDNLVQRLAAADVVLAALGRRQYVLSADMVIAALRQRRRRPVFIVDAGIPGDVEPAVNRIDEAFLYDLGDLERVAMEGRSNREAEARAAWRIVDAEVAAFLHGRAERRAAPALTRLRAYFEAMRVEALADAGGDAERATRLLVNRLLHGPSRTLRALGARPASGRSVGQGDAAPFDLAEAERTLDLLFGLDAAAEAAGEPSEAVDETDDARER
jgi:glutamyl-tRNA reductase